MKEQMMPIILNESLERVAQVDDYISFIWTSRFYSPGDFELCCNLSYTEYIYKGAYIARLNDDHLGIVEKIQYKLTEDQQEMLIASGRLLPSILARRVISAQTQLTGRVTTAMSTLITQNAIIHRLQRVRLLNCTLRTTQVIQMIWMFNISEKIYWRRSAAYANCTRSAWIA